MPRRLAIKAAVVSVLIGVAIAMGGLAYGFPPSALGLLLLGGGLGWQYSLPPLSLEWRGWGELTNAGVGGLLPTYGYATARGAIHPVIVLAILPFFALAFANLLDTTWPDRKADAAVGKATLATRLPPARLQALYVVTVLGWLGSILVLRGWVFPAPVVIAGLLSGPFVVWGMVSYTRHRSPFPSVAAMVITAVLQLLAWSFVAGQ